MLSGKNNIQPQVLIIMGPPGSGKGTQAKKISEHFNISHISTGDLFRLHIKNKTELGIKVSHILASGLFVDDDIVCSMVSDQLQAVSSQGCILEGFPRNLYQANTFDNIMRSINLKLYIINLDVSDDVIYNRLCSRLICDSCGSPYTQTESINKNDKCLKCNGILIHRPDDNIEVIKNRLITYHRETDPVKMFYKNKQQLIEISAESDPESIFQEIIKKIT